ncbi:conserved hypothetical protein [Ricinus communis]|uniref:Uncharacterized protein n=1 Tax=Ricinus communis TaxID=3988 RepID=B9TD32_RICCO|nr:conserved hypothetical protein [Ricinus communis]
MLPLPRYPDTFRFRADATRMSTESPPLRQYRIPDPRLSYTIIEPDVRRHVGSPTDVQ